METENEGKEKEQRIFRGLCNTLKRKKKRVGRECVYVKGSRVREKLVKRGNLHAVCKSVEAVE